MSTKIIKSYGVEVIELENLVNIKDYLEKVAKSKNVENYVEKKIPIKHRQIRDKKVYVTSDYIVELSKTGKSKESRRLYMEIMNQKEQPKLIKKSELSLNPKNEKLKKQVPTNTSESSEQEIVPKNFLTKSTTKIELSENSEPEISTPNNKKKLVPKIVLPKDSDQGTKHQIKNKKKSFSEYDIEIIDETGEKWTCGVWYCKKLNYTNPKKAIRDHVNKNNKKTGGELLNWITGCNRTKIYINQMGITEIQIKSRKPESLELFKGIKLYAKIPYKETEITHQIKKYLDTCEIKYETQKKLSSYFIDIYLPEYKIAIEIDENWHKDRPKEYEQKRELYLRQSGMKVLRVNPDDPEYCIFTLLGTISKEINKEINKNLINIKYDL